MSDFRRVDPEGFDKEITDQLHTALQEARERFGPLIEAQVNSTISTAVEEKASVAARESVLGYIPPLLPIAVKLAPLMETTPPPPANGFVDKEVPDELSDLVDKPPRLAGHATEDADGRRVPVVLAIVHDEAGATREGMLVRLADKDERVLLDHTRTDANGLALLRFPPRDDGGRAASGTLTVAGVNRKFDVTVPADAQHVVTDVTVELPRVPAVDDPGPDRVPTMTHGDSPLERLPSDFGTDLCAAITRLAGPVTDPILGPVAGAGDFRGQRAPLVKRLTVPRLGEIPEGAVAPRRYLVRLRQEWTFLGYTLGELAGVDALDPGAIVEQATTTLQRTTSQTARETDELLSEARSTLASLLRQTSSIDSLLEVAARTETAASASGFGGIGVGGGIFGGLLGIVGGVFGGVGGGLGIGAGGGTRTTASVLASTTTRSTTDTSLLVNSSMHTARSAINRAVRTIASTLRELQSTVSTVSNQVSPLLSRVTNLIRWTVYENYAVCTHVEDVVEIQSVRLTTPAPASVPMFSDEDIVEYRRYFEPALLERSLASQFPILASAIAERIAGGAPISTIHVAVDYSAAIFDGHLRVAIGDRSVTLPLRSGATTARASLRLSRPLLAGQLQQADLNLVARVPVLSSSFFPSLEALFRSGGVTVSQIRIWFESSPASAADQTEALGTTLQVTNDNRTSAMTVSLRPPVRVVDTTRNPLFRHVHRNRTYYFGVLAQAALAEPSLRDDAPELASFPGDHQLWRLPVYGFEGDRVLVLRDVARDDAGDVTDPDARRLIDDPGAATIIQLAAPGAYAEALQGLLELTGDVAGKVHPALLPPLAPVMPPLALVDLTGKTLQVVDGAP